jgi:hypothetical protein
MNTPQTIFSFLFALYFPAIVAITSKFQPFDTPSMFNINGSGKRYAWLRFIMSMFLINFFPGGVFVLIFNWLKFYDSIRNYELNIGAMAILISLSIVGFGIYRIYFGIMLIKCGHNYLFYGQPYEGLPKSLRDDMCNRPEWHKNIWLHIIPGIIWCIIPLIIGFFWTH